MDGPKELESPSPEPVYKTKAYAGQGGNISMSSPGGSIRRKPTTAAAFQKARRRK